MGPGHVCRHAPWGGQPHVGVEPMAHVVVEERPDRPVTLQGPPVEGEEQTLEVAQRGIGQIGPHPADHGVGLAGPVLTEVQEAPPRPGLHLADDRKQEPVLRSEVVQQHAMAGPDRLGDPTQALVGQPLLREVRDDGVEEALTGSDRPSRPVPTSTSGRRPCARLSRHVPNGTFPGTDTWEDWEDSHGAAGDRRDRHDRRGSGLCVRAPGGRLHLAAVVAPRFLRAARARGRDTRGPRRRPAVHHGSPQEPRAGRDVPARARSSPTSWRPVCPCGTTGPW